MMSSIPKWKCRDGREIEVSKMATAHIENALAMLKRKNVIGPRTLAPYFSAAPMGDAASDAVQAEFDDLLSHPVSVFIDIFEDELSRRRANTLVDIQTAE